MEKYLIKRRNKGINMDKVARTSISVRPYLLKMFDTLIKEKGYKNRSEAINDVLREFIHSQKSVDDTATLQIIYDHRKGHLNTGVTKLQHEYNCMVLCSSQIYLEKHKCLTTIVMRGRKSRIIRFSEKLRATAGVLRVSLSFLQK